MGTIENRNVSYTRDELSALEQRIRANVASEDEYENLNSFVSSMGMTDFLKKQFREMNVFDFKVFIEERKRPKEYQDIRKEAILLGTISGIIAELKTRV